MRVRRIRRGDAIRYGFAVGRVRVLETRLLSRATYERLLDAPGFAEQKRVLSETHFGRYLDGAQTASDVERGIDASLADLYDEFLEKAELPEPVVRFFQLAYDFANLKGWLKARLLGSAARPAMRPLGQVPPEAFDAPGGPPGHLGELARVLEATEDLDAERLEWAVDAAMFAALRSEAADSRIDLLAELVARMTDVANVKVLMRAAAAGRTAADVERMLLEGGTFDATALADVVRRPLPEAAVAVASAARIPADMAADLADLERLDVTVDRVLADIVRAARRTAFGPEPVLSYVLAREAEALSLRALLVGKLVGLDRATVSGRLREASA